MDIGVAGIDVEELVEIGVHRHDGESPLVTKSTLERIRRFSLFMTLYSSTNSDKLSDIGLYWQLHGKPRVADIQVNAVTEADWQALVQR
jgi:hypothetical protein